MISKTYRVVQRIQQLISNFIFHFSPQLLQSVKAIFGFFLVFSPKLFGQKNHENIQEIKFGIHFWIRWTVFFLFLDLIVFSNLFLDSECSFPEHLHVRQCTILVKSRSFASLLSCSSWEPRPLLAFAKVEGWKNIA